MPQPVQNNYGAASKFGFDDPNKWVTLASVPLLDEHEMTNESGRPIAQVDRAALEEIARNNNRKVYETGDPATLILGHTSDDPRAPEKPAVGFVTNFQVKPFKRDETGRVIYALHGDYKVRPKNAHLLEDYPRRSVELWWSRKDIDPIAMLGGSSPERDLGAVIRNGRLNHVGLTQTHKTGITGNPVSWQAAADKYNSEVIRFTTRGQYTIESYSIDAPPVRRSRSPSRRQPTPRTPMNNTPRRYGCGPSMNGKTKYGADDIQDDGLDSFDPGDEGVDGGDPDGGGNESPLVAELMQSKAWKDLTSKIDMIAEALGGVGGGPGDGPLPGDDGMGGPEMPPPGAGGAGMDPMAGGAGGGMDAPGGMLPGEDGMDAMGGDPPVPPDEADSRRAMGAKPVQMSAGGGPTGFAGPSNTTIPGVVNKGSKRPAQMSRGAGMNGSTRRGTPARNANDERMAALERDNRELRMKYARAEAEKIISELATTELIQFGRSTEEHAQGMAESVDYFTHLLTQPGGDKDVEYEVGVIRSRYSRRRPNPAAPVQPGLARFSRSPQPTPGSGEEDFEPETDQEASQMADLMYAKMPRAEIIKYMRQRRAAGG